MPCETSDWNTNSISRVIEDVSPEERYPATDMIPPFADSDDGVGELESSSFLEGVVDDEEDLSQDFVRRVLS